MPVIQVIITAITDAEGDDVLVLSDRGDFDGVTLRIGLGPGYTDGCLVFLGEYTIAFTQDDGTEIEDAFSLTSFDDEYANFT